jgi:DNA-binding transcriptional regulator YhcF (GntR family)
VGEFWRRAAPHRKKGLGMKKKDLLTVKELAAELRMSPKSVQRA